MKGGGRFFLWFSSVSLVLLLSACHVFYQPIKDHNDKVIVWSGYQWFVKESTEMQGPGPNYFSSSSDNVWVDDNGFLHLKILRKNDRWYCSEIISALELGYGTYTIELVSKIDQLDPNAVFGFFSWRHGRSYSNNEMDIEFSRWGDPDGPNGQYVVQPHYYPGHMKRFYFEQSGSYSTHEFEWLPYSVSFRSYHGHNNRFKNQFEIASWDYAGWRIPRPRHTSVRLNFWLNNTSGLQLGEEAEIVLKSFVFSPPGQTIIP